MLKTFVIVTVSFLGTPSSPKGELPGSLNVAAIRAIPVQHDGRVMPLDTLARDVVESVTGREDFKSRDPVLWLLAWTFDPQTWMQQPLIRIANLELRGELKLPASQSEFSFSELARHEPLHHLIEGLAKMEPGRKPDPLESKVQDINDKLMQLQRVFQGEAVLLIPDAQSSLNAWKAIGNNAAETAQDPATAHAAWAKLGEAFRSDDAPAFARASEQLSAALAALPAAFRPGAKLIATELRYNALRPFHTAALLMIAGAILAAVGLWVSSRRFDVPVMLGLIAGFGVLTYGLSMRWQLAGRIPASNMYESLLFLSWGMGAFAILSGLILRQRLVPLTASAMGALALFLADSLPLDYFIRPIPPVLQDTIWMSIHVPIIMVSYSVLALAVLFAHVQVVVMALAPGRRQIADKLDWLHYWYVSIGSILLIAGIITGSMWAASSWGRYWGWDSKEVWSLVAFLGYMAILHIRIDREQTPAWAYVLAGLLGLVLFALIGIKLAPLTMTSILALSGAAGAVAIFVLARGQFATALKSILAFWLIIMTYVGVNYVLGTGLHSYGFGTGAVVNYMLTLGGLDLTLVAVCCGVYVIRSGWRLSPQDPAALASPA